MANYTIALVDWHSSGHHVSYTRLFAQTLRGMGHRVIVLCPEAAAMRTALGGIRLGQLAVEEFQRVKYPLWPTKLRRWAEARRISAAFRQLLAQCEREMASKCDLVFFNCFYEQQAWLVSALADTCECPWSCLYLHAKSLPPHPGCDPTVRRLLEHPKLRAFGVLDERTMDAGQQITGKRIIQFPDITDNTSKENHWLEQELREFADGAPLVLIIGHLLRSKGYATLAQLARDPQAQGLHFAFVGECNLRGKEGALLKDVMKNAANAFFRLGRLPDEAAYNACVRAADVLFAAYRDFPHSSNTLTKAAVFEKPVIVSEGHLMAERVRKYRMGEVVPQDDPAATLAAIRAITSIDNNWKEKMRPDWAGFRNVHSRAALKHSFAQIIAASVDKQEGETT